MSGENRSGMRLADALNKEPIVFRDCTGNEILLAFTYSFSLGIGLAILMGIFVMPFMIALIIGLILGLTVSYAAMGFIASSHNKYYESWLNERVFTLKVTLNELFPMKTFNFINESKRYGRGRK